MLSHNSLLEAIASEFASRSRSSFEPDLENIVSRFKRTEMGMRKNYSIVHLASRLCELAVRYTLEDISSKYPGRIVLDPIRNVLNELKTAGIDNPVIQKGKYRFQVGFSGTIESLARGSRDSWRGYAEYDEIFVADGKPTVVEVKLQVYGGETGLLNEDARKNVKQKNSKIVNAISPGNIERVLAPIREFFSKPNCGYVLVMPPDQIVQDYALSDFEERGGIIVPFYSERQKFIDIVAEAKQRYGL